MTTIADQLVHVLRQAGVTLAGAIGEIAPETRFREFCMARVRTVVRGLIVAGVALAPLASLASGAPSASAPVAVAGPGTGQPTPPAPSVPPSITPIPIPAVAHAALTAAKIEIPFPQRDVHIRSVDDRCTPVASGVTSPLTSPRVPDLAKEPHK